ncbi:hypothetical protein [Sporosarcina contaminans]|uniref:hypothetical protein n=1 Tax=Sporosarcina contaminans TaxID=633403 RepID=UPI0036D237CF
MELEARSLGAEVVASDADVSNAEDVDRFVSIAEKSYKPQKDCRQSEKMLCLQSNG